MRSSVADRLPPAVRRSLVKLGGDIALARRKRSLTVQMMAERIGVDKKTYLRVEKGDPRVSLGAYAMTLFVLGLPEGLGDLADAGRDQIGLSLDEQHLPRRVRLKRTRSPYTAPAPPSSSTSSRRPRRPS
jgi:DNA-binding XRE family transcriptional regulator